MVLGLKLLRTASTTDLVIVSVKVIHVCWKTGGRKQQSFFNRQITASWGENKNEKIRTNDLPYEFLEPAFCKRSPD